MQHTEYNPRLAALQRNGIIAAIAGAVILGIGLVSSRETFFQAYLYAFLFWNGLSLGCLSALMLHHVVAGRWGFMIQRIVEAGARNLWLDLVLLLPIVLIGMDYLYPWTPARVEMESEFVQGKVQSLLVPVLDISWYNKGFFVARALVYFAVWIFLATRLTSLSQRQDQTGDQRITLRMRSISSFGLLAYVISVTFAACDWGMSLEPEWFSTIYGPLFVVGFGLATLAFSIIMLNKIADEKPLAAVIKTDYFHHLGSLACGFVVLWSYISFSQYLITYAGNLPEEIPWYLHRQTGGVEILATLLIAFHFFLPLFILLQRRVKRARAGLLFMAKWLLVAHMLDLFFIIIPAFHPNFETLTLMNVVIYAGGLLCLGGIWLALFVRNLQKYPLLPLHDDRMDEAIGVGVFAHEEASEHAA
ncbi:MAG: hypothetical protein SGI88_14380 [Candidatus Hydrogenedentes bacterium]|nr:hypothetical protein [Candidatus Hydrogenedentota bacterium]